MGREAKRELRRRSPTLWFGGVLVVSAFVTAAQSVQRSLLSSSDYMGAAGVDVLASLQEATSGMLQENGRTNSICSGLSTYFDEADLSAKIEENVDFHQRGGNLKSVQEFRDSAIDSTLEKHDMKFIPKGQTEPVKKVTEFLREYYKENTSLRNGYGEQLPGKYSAENAKVIHKKRWVDVIEERKGRFKHDAALGPVGPDCKNMVELGTKEKDGYKFICMPEGETGKRDDGKCHVVSVGGNDNWKFEEAVYRRLGCTTHTFDCTLPGGKPKKKPKNDNIRFYNYCIDGHSHEDSHGRKYLPYADMIELMGIDKAPTYFKMDVEGFEYDVFTQMIRTSPKLLPTQIQVELHWVTRMTGLPWMPRTRSAGELALLTSMMFTSGGYIPIKLDFNKDCPSCMEVLYIRASCPK